MILIPYQHFHLEKDSCHISVRRPKNHLDGKLSGSTLCKWLLVMDLLLNLLLTSTFMEY